MNLIRFRTKIHSVNLIVFILVPRGFCYSPLLETVCMAGALGMVEIKGLIGSIEAVGAMVKSARGLLN